MTKGYNFFSLSYCYSRNIIRGDFHMLSYNSINYVLVSDNCDNINGICHYAIIMTI